jgi:hypothetical protein
VSDGIGIDANMSTYLYYINDYIRCLLDNCPERHIGKDITLYRHHLVPELLKLVFDIDLEIDSESDSENDSENDTPAHKFADFIDTYINDKIIDIDYIVDENNVYLWKLLKILLSNHHYTYFYSFYTRFINHTRSNIKTLMIISLLDLSCNYSYYTTFIPKINPIDMNLCISLQSTFVYKKEQQQLLLSEKIKSKLFQNANKMAVKPKPKSKPKTKKTIGTTNISSDYLTALTQYRDCVYDK